jgi:hypothetical protein
MIQTHVTAAYLFTSAKVFVVAGSPLCLQATEAP